MIEDILAVVGDVQILKTIIVIITDADALAPAGVSEAGFLGDIGKRAFVIVAVEMIGGSIFYGRALEFCAVDDEDVGPAVIVVVENRDAGAGGFDDVFFGGYATEGVGHGEAGLFCDVREVGERLGGCALGIGEREEKGKRENGGKDNLEDQANRAAVTGSRESHAFNG